MDRSGEFVYAEAVCVVFIPPAEAIELVQRDVELELIATGPGLKGLMGRPVDRGGGP